MTTSEKIEAARSRVNTRAFNNFLDNKRRTFLDRLHVAAQPATTRATDGREVVKLPLIRLTEWEQVFVADLVSEPRPLTDPQRDKIDELRRRHESRL